MKVFSVVIGVAFALVLCGVLWANGMEGVQRNPVTPGLCKAPLQGELTWGASGMDQAPLLLAKKKKKKKKSAGAGESSGGGGTISLDLNKATEKEFTILPLVDKEKAQAIVKYREQQPFKTTEEITNVPGITPCMYRIFKHLIKVEEQKPADEEAAPESAEETTTG